MRRSNSSTLFFAIATLFAACAAPARAAEVLRIDQLDPLEDLRSERFEVERPVTLHLHCEGAGDGPEELYAYGWILDNRSRDVVWSLEQTESQAEEGRRIVYDGSLTLQPGDYTAYYAACGRWRSSHTIFRWKGKEWFRIEHDDKSRRNRLRQESKTWGLVLETRADSDLGSIDRAPAPLAEDRRIIVRMVGQGDDAFETRGFTLPERARVTVYCLGEWSEGDGAMADAGWILDAATRKQVWAIGPDNFRHAGGAAKNKMARETIALAAGNYIISYSTDDTHSDDDWNAPPPYDPDSWGITVWAESEDVARRVRPYDDEAEHRALVSLVRQRSDAYASQGFTLKRPTRLRVYALGENGSDGLADRGWIQEFKSRRRAWEMTPRNTHPAGGASKNVFADEVVSLPPGDYVVYYQTDDSHAFEEWNAAPPHDPEHWGITLYEVDRVAKSDFELFDAEGREESGHNYLVRLVRLGDDVSVSRGFRLDRPTRVRIIAVGEGVEPEMVDYGWIENLKDGTTVWELTWRNSRPAGGAKKNRMFDGVVLLDKGEYQAHFVTDSSHAWGTFNAPPPDEPEMWGMTVMVESELK